MSTQKSKIHPPKQTWNLKMDPWKRRFLLETIISRFHVNFWGCRYPQMVIYSWWVFHQPIWKICGPSNWIMKPQGFRVKIHKYLSCHHRSFMFGQRSHLLQSIILDIYVSFRGCRWFIHFEPGWGGKNLNHWPSTHHDLWKKCSKRMPWPKMTPSWTNP